MNHTSAWPTGEIEAIIEKYGDMLYRLSVIMLKNDSDAEDVVQETIIKFYQNAPAFADSEHEKAWLTKVATNKCRDLLRFRQRHPQVDDASLEKIACHSSESGILEALTALPEKYRLALTLYYVEEYRIADIAKMINRTPSAVKMRLQKGRKLLEEIYRKEYL